MIVDVKFPLSRFAAELLSASLKERCIASEQFSDEGCWVDCCVDGRPVVTLNGWFVLIVDGGWLRKHNVVWCASCLSSGFEGCFFLGLSLGSIA